MKKAIIPAVCGVVTALSVVLMFLGGAIYIFAYVAPLIVGLLMILLKKAFGPASAWITYAATSALSFMLVADRECTLMYIMFFGFYPIIASDINRIKSKALKWFVKRLLFNFLMIWQQIMLVYVFGIPLAEDEKNIGFILLFFLLLNLLFSIYEKLIIKLSLLYDLKLKKSIQKFLK